jgi:predicted alpha/beta-hydrolase family hydrolase
MPDELSIPGVAGGAVTALRYAANDALAPVLVLAHGAGAGQRSPFMAAFAEAMCTRGVTTVTFDFPYMQQHRRVPDRAPVLEGAWRAVVEHLVSTGATAPGLVIGGKSMGGRMASHVLSDPGHPLSAVVGLVLLGYPLHPPGQPDKLRVAHLPALATPTLVVQGSTDAFGTEEEVRRAFAAAPGPVDWLIVRGGDHSFKVPRRGGQTQAEVGRRVHDTVAAWVRARSAAAGAQRRP